MDLLVSFLRQFRAKTGTIERDVVEIANNYFNGWFTVDFVSVIPFDVITLEEVGIIASDTGAKLKVHLLPAAQQLLLCFLGHDDKTY